MDTPGNRNSAHRQYDLAAQTFADRYESLRFARVHANILHFLPNPPAHILDVGAGSGRDAAALAALGHQIVAVEPSSKLREIGQRLHRSGSIQWVDDRLPGLPIVKGLQLLFDFILLSAVWMHVPPDERAEAMDTLGELTKDGARIVVTLRHATPDPSRHIYPVDATELIALARRRNLIALDVFSDSDQLGRDDVTWSTVAFEQR